MSPLDEQQTENGRPARQGGIHGYPLILVAAIVVHLALLEGLWSGWATSLFNDGHHRLGRGEDFFCFYQAGRNALHGASVFHDFPQLYVVPRHGAEGYRYLPLFAYTVGIALNALPPWPAYYAWVGLTELLLIVNIVLTWNAAKKEPPRVRFVAAAMWLAYMPYAIEIHMGQSSFVQTSLIFWMGLALARGRMGLFDRAWVGSVLFKMNTFLLAPLLVRLRRARPILVAGAVAALSSAAYFAFFPKDFADFFGFNFEDSFLGTLHAGNLGLQALFRGVFQNFAGLAGEPEMARALALVPTMAIVAVALWVTFRSPVERAEDLFGMWMALYFVLYKDVWEHHYVMLLPVLVLFYLRGAGWWLAPLFLLVALPTPLGFVDSHVGGDPEEFWNRYVSLLYHASKAVPTLVLAGWLAARAVGRPAFTRGLKLAGASAAAGLVALLLFVGPGIQRQGLGDSTGLVRMGEAYLRARDPASAAEAYRRVLEITPSSPFARGFFAMQEGGSRVTSTSPRIER